MSVFKNNREVKLSKNVGDLACCRTITIAHQTGDKNRFEIKVMDWKIAGSGNGLQGTNCLTPKYYTWPAETELEAVNYADEQFQLSVDEGFQLSKAGEHCP